MNSADISVLLGSAILLAAFWWWFFGSRRVAVAAARLTTGGVQEVEILVKGGYKPDRVTLRAGVPARLTFTRRESGACTDRVVIPAFGITRPLPAYASTPVDLAAPAAGEYDFSCGMGMIHGKLVVEERAGP